MELSREILKQFAQIANGNSNKKQTTPSYMNATAVVSDGVKYVQIDGSDQLTPVSETMGIQNGDRVLVTIENHQATVIGNYSYPADARTANEALSVGGQALTAAGQAIQRIDVLQASSITTENLQAGLASIGYLTATELRALNATVDTLDAKAITTDTLETESAKIGFVKAAQIEGTYATIEQLNAATARIGTLETDTLKSKDLESEVGKFGYLKADEAKLTYATIEQLNAKTVTADEILGVVIKAGYLTADNADLKYATITSLNAVTARIGTLETDTLKTKDLESEVGKFGYLKASNLESEVGEFGYLKADDAEVTYATIGALNAEAAKITNLNADFAQFQSAVTQDIVAAKGWMAEGSIGDAQISKVSANKLDAGTIDTSVVTVLGSDGRLQIVDNTLQISDANRVRVQVGKDDTGDYTLAVWDVNGQLIWDALGATENTIQRAIIRDNMVAGDAAIQALKIDFQSFETALTEQGIVISGTVVQVGDKSLNVALTEQSQTISDNYTSLVSYTDTAKAAAISAAASDATTKANSALSSAKSYADEAVDGIEIGGRNLVIGSNAYRKDTPMSFTSSEIDGIKSYTDMYMPCEINETYTLQCCTDGIWGDHTLTGTATGWTHIYLFLMTDETPIGNWVKAISLYQDPTKKLTGRQKWKFTVPDDGNAYTKIMFRFDIHSDGSTEYTVRWWDLKVEKGNKATDWTPAPEDTQSQIDNTNATIATHTETLSTHTSQIAANESAIALRVTTQDFNSYKTTVNEELTSAKSRLTTAESSITALNGEIVLKVEQTDIDTAVNGIEIGGRNLIRHSYIVNRGCSSFSYDKASNTWTCVAPAGSDQWGYGFVISSGKKIIIPRGRTFIVSLEVNPEVECEWSNDVNNNSTLTDLNSNDNDNSSLRKISSNLLPANKWTKVWFSYTAKNDVEYDLYDASSNFGIVTTDLTEDVNFQFRNVMGELANKPSEYSPAPEDIDASISDVDAKFANYSTTTQMTAAITAAKDNITQSVSETYSTKAELSTVSGNVSALTTRVSTAESKLTKDSLVTTIGSYYSTKTYVDEAVDGIEIGGRNLLIGSSDASNLGVWVKQGWSPNIETYNADERTYLLSSNNGWGAIGYPVSEYIGQTLTISGWVKLRDDSTNTEDVILAYTTEDTVTYNQGIYVPSGYRIALSKEEWRYTSATFDSAKNYIKFFFRGCNSDGGTGKSYVLIKDLKIEKGNRATDWTPAPEDVDSQITSVKTIATQTAEKFEWMVRSDSTMSSLVLTDTMLTAITDQFKVVGPDGSTTIISGGTMNINNIFAQDIVASGSISGVTLHGVYGEIGGWNINSNCLYSSYTDGDETTTVVMQNIVDDTQFSYAYVTLDNCTATINGTSVLARPVETAEANINIKTPLETGSYKLYIYSGYIAKYSDVANPDVQWQWIDSNGDLNIGTVEFATEVDRWTNSDGSVRVVKMEIDFIEIPTGSTDAKLFITHPMPSAKVGETYEFIFQLEQNGIVYDLSPKLSVAGVTIDKFLAVQKEVAGEVTYPFYVTGDGYLYAENALFTGNSAIELVYQSHCSILTSSGLTLMYDSNNNFVMPEKRLTISSSGITSGNGCGISLYETGIINVTGNLTVNGTLTATISANSLKTSQAGGWYTDNWGNFRHGSSDTSSTWCVLNNAGTAVFKVNYETGAVTTNSTITATSNITSSALIQGSYVTGTAGFFVGTHGGTAYIYHSNNDGNIYFRYMNGTTTSYTNLASIVNNINNKLPLSGGTITGALKYGASSFNNGWIELSGTTPFIDFHYNNSTADYTSRIIAQNGYLLLVGKSGYAVAVGASLTSGNYTFGPRTHSGAALDGKMYLGGSSNRWYWIYSSSGSVHTSDVRDKKIRIMDDRYKKLFMKLDPIIFTWKDDSMDKSTHIGLRAQDTEQAAYECGLTNSEIGAIVHDYWDEPNADGRTDRYSMQYEEFLMLTIPFVQSHELTLTDHAAKLDNIEAQLESLKTELDEAHIEIARLKKLANIS